jgi:formylglycine-generating enzyme required for sulfatase activity
MRLPTELEWERAARGLNGQKWPWGSNPHVTYFANVLSGINRRNAETVYSYPQGKSQEGIYNLVGNVWEWTASYYQPSYQKYDKKQVLQGSKEEFGSFRGLILRGGSWKSEIKRVTQRLRARATDHQDYIGIRCAK